MTRNKQKGRWGKPVKNDRGWIVGEIIDELLVKIVRSSRHMLRDPRGWAWDEAIITQAEAQGMILTLIRDDETGKVYGAKLSDFRKYGVQVNRGFGVQLCLPMRHWQVISDD